MTTTEVMQRSVTADIDLDVVQPGGKVVFQIAAVKAPGLAVNETLELTLDGAAVKVDEVVGVTGTRFHVVEPKQAGKMLVSYRATVTGRADAPEVVEAELIEYLRPSR